MTIKCAVRKKKEFSFNEMFKYDHSARISESPPLMMAKVEQR